MCLESRQKRPRISLRRRKIYKVLIKEGSVYYTPFQLFTVRLNELYKNQENEAEKIKKTDTGILVYGGFYHACLELLSAKVIAASMKTYKDLYYKNVMVVEGYVPMFTKYYKGEHHDIAAKKIKYKKEVYEI